MQFFVVRHQICHQCMESAILCHSERIQYCDGALRLIAAHEKPINFSQAEEDLHLMPYSHFHSFAIAIGIPNWCAVCTLSHHCKICSTFTLAIFVEGEKTNGKINIANPIV